MHEIVIQWPAPYSSVLEIMFHWGCTGVPTVFQSAGVLHQTLHRVQSFPTRYYLQKFMTGLIGVSWFQEQKKNGICQFNGNEEV